MVSRWYVHPFLFIFVYFSLFFIWKNKKWKSKNKITTAREREFQSLMFRTHGVDQLCGIEYISLIHLKELFCCCRNPCRISHKKKCNHFSIFDEKHLFAHKMQTSMRISKCLTHPRFAPSERCVRTNHQLRLPTIVANIREIVSWVFLRVCVMLAEAHQVDCVCVPIDKSSSLIFLMFALILNFFN